MSSRKSRRIEEVIQILNIVSKNPALLTRDQVVRALAEKVYTTPEDLMSVPDLYYVSFESRPKTEDALKKTIERQVDEICQKVRIEVLEQVRSDISRLLDATKKEASVENMTRAVTESIRKVSEIPEVKKIYAFLEPGNLCLIIIHSAMDRISMLRRIVEIENSLDLRFEDIYFEFKILHLSEIDENLISDALLIFERA